MGRVTDSSGLVVPAATVQITNTATNVMVTSTTNQDGNFFTPYLIPGTYNIVVSKTGFKKLDRNGLQVNIGSRIEINLQLELGAVSERYRSRRKRRCWIRRMLRPGEPWISGT